MTIKATGKREVSFQCRDIGYGIETGTVIGYWNEGETNLGGAPAFDVVEVVVGCENGGDPVHASDVIYLFDDEVLSDEAVAQ